MTKEHLTFNRYYFITYILTDKITEDEGLAILANIFNNSNNICEVLEIKKCGIKKLNYTIQNKYDYGTYYTMMIKTKEDEMLATKIKEMNRLIKGNQKILRSLMCRTYGPNTPMLPDTLAQIKPMFDKHIGEFKVSKMSR